MKKDRHQNYFVVIPACNEELRLEKFLRKVKKITKKIIVVDDGSVDNTGKIAKQANVRVIRHELNLGKGAAMKTGIEAAILKKADSVIFINADGQHKPENIDLFVRELDKGYDFVFGSRKYSPSIPLIKNIGKNIVTKMINIILRTNRSDVLCGFFALKTKNYSLVKWSSNDYGVETEIAIKNARQRLKFSEVPRASIYLKNNNGIAPLNILRIVFNIPRWIIC